MKKILGIDVGERRIGIAVALGENVFEREALAAGKKSISEILEIIKEEEIEEIVIGLPKTLEGREGKQAGLARGFAAKLAGKTSVPILFFDERFSTVEAEKRLRGMEVSERGLKERIDSMAAAVILEDYLK